MRVHYLIGLVTMTIFVSCDKNAGIGDNEGMVLQADRFSASMEADPLTRTTLSGYANSDGSYSLLWQSGDAISIFDGMNTAVYVTADGYSPTADFVRSIGDINHTASQYVAFYPSTITPSNMVLPASQNHVDNNISEFPMRAVSTNKQLAFKNLCGIIRLSLKSEENGQVEVASISLSSDKGMSGPFTVGDDQAAIVTGTNGVVMKCAEPKPLYANANTDFNIIVPQGDYDPLKVKISDGAGSEINLVSEGAVSVRRNEITRITLTLAKSSFDTSLETIPITDSNVDFSER